MQTESPEEAETLQETCEAFANACNYALQIALERNISSRYRLHKLVYYEIRQRFGLSANLACQAIRCVAEEVLKMVERTVYYFEDRGPENTDATLNAVVERAKEGDIQAIIVASMSGRTAIKVAEGLKAAGFEMKVICVTGPPSWEQYGYKMPLLKDKERRELEKLGAQIVDQIEEPFRELTFCNWWLKKTRL